ncbi:hypothetical protein AB0D68_34985 [Streptomyces sp. NPDC048212]|uniref:hypothetical protein n=1 Tax=Streptomyces sp. NPDC048212 TaxID=3156658 RepID=UPI0033EF9F8F
MPYSGSVNVTIGDQRLEDVEYIWEDMYNPARRGKVGWGMGIELPAVIDMVRLAADGVVTAGQLVKHLEALAENVRAEYDEDDAVTWGADCPAVGCKVCDAAKEEFAAIAATTLTHRKRLQDPATYPYAGGKHTLHSSVCRETKERVGKIPGPDDPWNNDARNLRQFAHEGLLNSSWATHMVMLTPQEALQWIYDRTGPRGGSQYKLCKVCRPQAPQL